MTDGRKLLLTRGIRGLADGVASIALASYLTHLGFGPFEVGAIITGTLLLVQFRAVATREDGVR